MPTDTRLLSLADIDLNDLDVWAQGVPHAWFDLLRREAPVFWSDMPGGRGYWSITRYEDVVAVNKDWQTFSSERGGTSLQDLSPEHIESRKSMIDTDPPRHTRLRAIVNKGFTPRAIAAYEQQVRQITREILSEAFEREEFDWVKDVAVEIPMQVFCRIMGLPEEDRLLLVELSDKMLGNTDPDIVDEPYDPVKHAQYAHLPFSSPAALDMFDFGRRLAERRRKDPQDDITTKLVFAEVDGDSLSPREFDVFFLLLTTAGNETTRHTISHGVNLLLRNPDQLRRLQAEPAMIPLAVEEILRHATPVVHFRRTATQDVEMNGEVIRENDKVVFWYVGANFDPAVFTDPQAFDVGRNEARNVTFGLGGPHFCLGAHLARMEVRVVLEELIGRLDRIELAGDPVYLRSNMFNGVKRLPVRVRQA